jgi:hypothetical protein
MKKKVHNVGPGMNFWSMEQQPQPQLIYWVKSSNFLPLFLQTMILQLVETHTISSDLQTLARPQHLFAEVSYSLRQQKMMSFGGRLVGQK